MTKISNLFNKNKLSFERTLKWSFIIKYILFGIDINNDLK